VILVFYFCSDVFNDFSIEGFVDLSPWTAALITKTFSYDYDMSCITQCMITHAPTQTKNLGQITDNCWLYFVISSTVLSLPVRDVGATDSVVYYTLHCLYFSSRYSRCPMSE